MIYLSINLSARTGCDTRPIFQQSSIGLNSEFSFSQTGYHTMVKGISLPYRLPVAVRRIIWFIPFPKILLLSEKKTTSSRIWTTYLFNIIITLLAPDQCNVHKTESVRVYETPKNSLGFWDTNWSPNLVLKTQPSVN